MSRKEGILFVFVMIISIADMAMCSNIPRGSRLFNFLYNRSVLSVSIAVIYLSCDNLISTLSGNEKLRIRVNLTLLLFSSIFTFIQFLIGYKTVVVLRNIIDPYHYLYLNVTWIFSIFYLYFIGGICIEMGANIPQPSPSSEEKKTTHSVKVKKERVSSFKKELI